MNIFASYLRFRQIQTEKKEIEEIMEGMDYNNQANIRPASINSILMLLPDVYPNLGGITSALRILRGLQRKGCDVYICCFTSMPITTVCKNVKECMPDLEARVIEYRECLAKEFDIVIATNWRSVYYANRINGYKVYFVQDYEPSFFPTNDEQQLCKQTYKMGFHIISLGEWNVKQIKKHIKMPADNLIDSVDFPYEPGEYKYIKRDYANIAKAKRIKIACYIKFSGRRIPYIIQSILEKAYKDLKERGIELDIVYFGIDGRNRFKIGKNLGKLSRSQLNELYASSDFGMVASMSNISLVPYEMLATGLPVIEFEDGSYKDFMGEDTAILIDYHYQTLVSRVLEAMNNPDELIKADNEAQRKLKTLSWDLTCEQFWKIISSI